MSSHTKQKKRRKKKNLRSNNAGVALNRGRDLAVLHFLEEHYRLLPPQIARERFHQRGVGVHVRRAVTASLQHVQQLKGLRASKMNKKTTKTVVTRYEFVVKTRASEQGGDPRKNCRFNKLSTAIDTQKTRLFLVNITSERVGAGEGRVEWGGVGRGAGTQVWHGARFYPTC